jgi:hypothetical protein
MIRALAILAILCGCLLALSEKGLDRMSVKALTEPRLVTVIITLKDADARYRWLSVYACGAALTSRSVVYCVGEWERESTQEIGAERQHLITWRDLPRGTTWITAMAFDADRKILARGQAVAFRGE